MSDDRWRDERDPDDFSEYGSLFDESGQTAGRSTGRQQAASPFGDPPGAGDLADDVSVVRASDPGGSPPSERIRLDPVDHRPEVDDVFREESVERLSFGDGGTGSLPHWTDPPTTEMPTFEPRRVEPDADEHADVDVWSSFSSDGPVWKDDIADDSDSPGLPNPSTDQLPATGVHQRVSGQQPRVTGQQGRVTGQQARLSGQHRRVTGPVAPVEREPSRITIGTDPSGMPRRAPAGGSRRRQAAAPPRRDGTGAPPAGRNMPIAIGVGVAIAAVFVIALTRLPPIAVVAIVTAVIGLGALEFYERVREKGYRPSIYPGLAACVGAPLAAYWMGDAALPLVLMLGFIAISAGFLGATSVESGPLPNVSITVLGTIWIGLLGSFAVLILRLPDVLGPLYEHAGTDTLFLVALGVVANDTGALITGSAFGRTPLREWISPNKTVEGLIGGTAFTIIALVVAGLVVGNNATTWVGTSDQVILAIVIAIMAPLGDLVESMFKRNLDIKDFGTIVRGHGGVLDRFDGFLFTLPAVYYLALVLKPWVG